MKKFQFPGYTIHLLEKYRQVASGIVVGVKSNLIDNFKILKNMGNTDDKMELINLHIWKDNQFFNIYAMYNPPTNKPKLDIINVNRKTILIGDFNSPSPLWGYSNTTPPGEILEDFLNSTNLELIYKSTDPPTYLHYNGNGTNPDLLFVSSDIADKTTRKVIEDPGSGHRIVIAKIRYQNKISQKSSPRVSWNFKKADWPKYTNILETELDSTKFNFTQHPDNLCKEINHIILNTAKKCIPLGRQKRYKCFWNDNLGALKKQRDEFRRQAEETKNAENVQKWRQSAAVFKRAILEAKRSSFNSFISKINYRTDSKKTHKFIDKIQNKNTVLKKRAYSL